MSAQTPLPADHPMRVAWDKYKSTPEYANSRCWARLPDTVDGSMWAAFEQGWRARTGGEKIAERLAESNGALKLVYQHGWKRGGESLGEIIDKNSELLRAIKAAKF